MELDQWYANILEARERIKNHVWNTPLYYSQELSDLGEANVFLKLECEQLTGAFKVRGAFNKLTKLVETTPSIKENGVTTASSGNHALACLQAMQKLGVKGKIYVPGYISASKEAALVTRGAVLSKGGDDCLEGELNARQAAEETGGVYISPYNDCDIVAGQGTIGIEILESFPELDVILVSVGGGGLIGGIAAYIKKAKPSVKVIGCQPEKSKVMYESVKAGKIIFEESYETLSDGTAGGIEEGAITFDLSKNYVDEWIMVSEDQIAKAMYFVMDKHHKIIEGAAGVSVGAYMANVQRFKGQNVAIVVCGGNISMDKVKYVMDEHDKHQGK